MDLTLPSLSIKDFEFSVSVSVCLSVPVSVCLSVSVYIYITLTTTLMDDGQGSSVGRTPDETARRSPYTGTIPPVRQQIFLPDSVLILLQCVNSHTAQPSCANGMHQHQRAGWKSQNTGSCTPLFGSCCCSCWSLLYIALFSALEQTPCARMWFYMSD